MGYRSDRYAAATPALTAPATLRAGIVHPFDTSGGAIAQPLPDAASFGASNGFYLLVETGGNSLTIAPAGSDTINGTTVPIVLLGGESALFVRDAVATNWLLIGGVRSPSEQRYIPTLNNLTPDFGELVSVDTGVSIILPEIVSEQIGSQIVVVKTVGGAEVVIVQPDGGQTINGAGFSFFDAPFGSRIYVPDQTGTNWVVMGEPPSVAAPRLFVVTANVNPWNAEFNYIVQIPSGAWSVQLPAASDAGLGQTIIVKKSSSDGATVTVLRNGSDTIDGVAASYTFSAAKGAVTLVQGSANWIITGVYS